VIRSPSASLSRRLVAEKTFTTLIVRAIASSPAPGLLSPFRSIALRPFARAVHGVFFLQFHRVVCDTLAVIAQACHRRAAQADSSRTRPIPPDKVRHAGWATLQLNFQEVSREEDAGGERLAARARRASREPTRRKALRSRRVSPPREHAARSGNVSRVARFERKVRANQGC
jgi:hypothetical protein